MRYSLTGGDLINFVAGDNIRDFKGILTRTSYYVRGLEGNSGSGVRRSCADNFPVGAMIGCHFYSSRVGNLSFVC